MSKYEPATPGPAWSDLHDYTEALQAQYSVICLFKVQFYAASKSRARIATVVVEARVSAASNAQVRALAYAQFRGNGGAATMPAAMLRALVELEGKLAGIETVAQLKMAF